ncbi:MAG: hypothetical protein DMG35_00830 [Acidobacteria bacterium]|nr:MAG: hypothetical protein DMG35_00830 [Acidobacteriota bacterium]
MAVACLRQDTQRGFFTLLIGPRSESVKFRFQFDCSLLALFGCSEPRAGGTFPHPSHLPANFRVEEKLFSELHPLSITPHQETSQHRFTRARVRRLVEFIEPAERC